MPEFARSATSCSARTGKWSSPGWKITCGNTSALPNAWEFADSPQNKKRVSTCKGLKAYKAYAMRCGDLKDSWCDKCELVSEELWRSRDMSRLVLPSALGPDVPNADLVTTCNENCPNSKIECIHARVSVPLASKCVNPFVDHRREQGPEARAPLLVLPLPRLYLRGAPGGYDPWPSSAH